MSADVAPAPSPVASVAPATPSATPRTAPTRARSTRLETVGALGTSFTVLGMLALWLLFQLSLLSTLSHDRAQALLYPELRSHLADATAPTGGAIVPGSPVAVLTIPTIGFRQVVVEGTSGSDLRAGPGHQRNTVLPGQAGISVVDGRAATYGAPFARITSVHRGDDVNVDMGQGRVVYTVLGVRRAGDPIPPLPTGSEGRLTLVTAEGSGLLASLRPSSVVYVDATVTKAFPAPAGRPSAVPPNEQVLGTDPGALPLLSLCLAALLGLALVVTAALQRWSAALVWVVAAPVVLAVAWCTGDVFVRLLPNLM